MSPPIQMLILVWKDGCPGCEHQFNDKPDHWKNIEKMIEEYENIQSKKMEIDEFMNEQGEQQMPDQVPKLMVIEKGSEFKEDLDHPGSWEEEKLLTKVKEIVDKNESNSASKNKSGTGRFSLKKQKHRMSSYTKSKKSRKHSKTHRSRKNQRARGLLTNLVMAGALLGTATSALRSKKNVRTVSKDIRSVTRGVTGSIGSILKPVSSVAEGVARGTMKVARQTGRTLGLTRKAKKSKKTRKGRK